MDLYQSCQRKFGTSRCPQKVDALRTVMQFAYDRWNRLNPDNQKDMHFRLQWLSL